MAQALSSVIDIPDVTRPLFSGWGCNFVQVRTGYSCVLFSPLHRRGWAPGVNQLVNIIPCHPVLIVETSPHHVCTSRTNSVHPTCIPHFGSKRHMSSQGHSSCTPRPPTLQQVSQLRRLHVHLMCTTDEVLSHPPHKGLHAGIPLFIRCGHHSVNARSTLGQRW
jgi:hypothetical protein